jgi:hypothetical protein
MTFRVVENPVEWVRGRPEMYFVAGSPDAFELVRAVWGDAVLSGVSDILVHHDVSAWVVAGSSNWLTDSRVPSAELFSRIVPLAAAGPNSQRSEILLNAFCSEVVAIAAGTEIFCKGTGSVRTLIDDVFRRWRGLETAVAFRL